MTFPLWHWIWRNRLLTCRSWNVWCFKAQFSNIWSMHQIRLIMWRDNNLHRGQELKLKVKVFVFPTEGWRPLIVFQIFQDPRSLPPYGLWTPLTFHFSLGSAMKTRNWHKFVEQDIFLHGIVQFLSALNSVVFDTITKHLECDVMRAW